VNLSFRQVNVVARLRSARWHATLQKGASQKRRYIYFASRRSLEPGFGQINVTLDSA
jgi:hypothetical protein